MVLRQGPPGTPQAALADKLSIFGPLLDEATSYAAGIDLDKGLAVNLVVTAASEKTAKDMDETLAALVTLAKNATRNLRQQPAPPRGQRVEQVLLQLFAEPILENARRVEGKDVRVVQFSSQTDVGVVAVVQSMMPSVIAVHASALRAQSVNNMRQILLAMLNYESTNGHFPPAVGRSPDGRVAHSWRVALLPYLEQDSLYKQYDFTEPWDSPKNLKLIDKMPAVYGYPGDVGESGKPGRAAYFVPTGVQTMFPPLPSVPGVKFAAITDGTANTIMLLEAKRNIPWTKPEDIPIDPGAAEAPNVDPAIPLPKLGGFSPNGFHAGMVDGSVRFLSHGINPFVLKALFTRAGGEVIDTNQLDPDRPGPAPTPTGR
jgi:Protein of unknown function (DUF1559)